MRKHLEFAGRTPALSATLVVTLVLLIVVFPALPIGGEMLDTRMAYTYAEAVSAMDSYDERGRQVYAWASLTLDTLLPLAYVSFLAGVVYRFRPTDRLSWLAFLPLATGLIDLGENVQLVFMLTRYPDVSAGQVAVGSSFTLVKWFAFSISLLLATALAIVAAVRRIRHRS